MVRINVELGYLARIEELESALKPFAEAAKYAEPDESDDYVLQGSSARFKLTLGDLRRAALKLDS